MISLESIKNLFEPLEPAIKVLGVPVAIYIFWRNKVKERREREYATYNTLDDKYNEFLKLCFDHPELGISTVTKVSKDLDEKQIYQRDRIFEMLISIFERAYLMYQDKDTIIKERQWSGWKINIEAWTKNPDFKTAWECQDSQWDKEFSDYIKDILNQAQGEVK